MADDRGGGETVMAPVEREASTSGRKRGRIDGTGFCWRDSEEERRGDGEAKTEVVGVAMPGGEAGGVATHKVKVWGFPHEIDGGG